MTHFGRVDMPWGDVNRLMHANVDLSIGGGPDILHATYGELQEDSRLKNTDGDSYNIWKASTCRGKRNNRLTSIINPASYLLLTDLEEGRVSLFANLPHLGKTSRVERAARRRVDRAGDVAFQDDALGSFGLAYARDGRQ